MSDKTSSLIKMDAEQYLEVDLNHLAPGATIIGNLKLGDKCIEELPPDLTIRGSLDLSGSKIKKLNPGLTIYGELILSHSLLTSLPERIYVEGDLILKNSLIEELPKYLTVYGNIDLAKSRIKKLSSHLVVRYLSLKDTEISTLPDYLKVLGAPHLEPKDNDGYLVLQGSRVTHIPEYAEIGYLDLSNTEVRCYGKNINIETLVLGENSLKGDPTSSYFTNVIISHDNTPLGAATLLNPVTEIQINKCLVKLPENLKLNCSLELVEAHMEQLPENLEINGYFTINNTPLEKLPSSLKINDGSLILSGEKTDCTFPENLSVRDLELYGTANKNLPNELMAAGYLVLEETRIENLSKKLEVGINLIIRNNCYPLVISPTSKIRIGHSLYWAYAPFESWPQNMLVCGGIYLAHSALRTLPDNFLVNGTLDLSHSRIEKLPTGLTVRGDLLINHTQILSLPENVTVYGKIEAVGTSLDSQLCQSMSYQPVPENWQPIWDGGKYSFFDCYDGCEIIEDLNIRKLIRPFGQNGIFWLEFDNGKWKGPYPNFKPEFPIFGY